MSEQDPHVPPAWPAPQPQWGQQPQWGAPAPHQQGTPPYGPDPYGQGPYGQRPYGQAHYVAPPKPGIVPLRPLMFGEILDGSFQTVRRNAKAMLGAALIAQSLAAVASAVVTTAAIAGQTSLGGWLQGLRRDELAALGFGVGGAALALALLGMLIAVVLQGAMVVPVARSLLNRHTGFRQMWALARPRAGSLLGLAGLQVLAFVAIIAVTVLASVLLANALGAVTFLIIVPVALVLMAGMVWVYIRFLVAPAAIVVEELGVLGGLRRSWHLTSNNWWRIFGITLVVSLMIGIVGQVIQIPISLVAGGTAAVVSPHGGDGADQTLAIIVGILGALVAAAVGAVAFAFQTSVVALLYTDLRMRKDGLDLDLMRMMETGADPDGVPGRVPGGMAAGNRNQPGHGVGQPPVNG